MLASHGACALCEDVSSAAPQAISSIGVSISRRVSSVAPWAWFGPGPGAGQSVRQTPVPRDWPGPGDPARSIDRGPALAAGRALVFLLPPGGDALSLSLRRTKIGPRRAGMRTAASASIILWW